MKTLLIYYSYSGKTEKIAKEYAVKPDVQLLPLRDEKKPGIFSAYLSGSFAAMKSRPANLAPFSCDWEQFDEFIIAMPIWAGCPAPAFNNVAAVLPEGKTVSLLMVSGSGNSQKSRERSIRMVEARGCTVKDYSDRRGR